jgi:hypothetical protein
VSRSPVRISRRRLLAASGVTLAAGAPVALAACGAEEDEDVSPEREAELLNVVLAQQLAITDATAEALRANPPEELRRPLGRLIDLREQTAQDLESAISDLGGQPVDTGAELVGAESPVEGLARQLEASIAASLGAIGELSPEQRAPVHDAIVEDATALAELRVVLGEDPAPDAFVMGPPSEAAA